MVKGKVPTLKEWAQRKCVDCPDCGGSIPNSWVKMTAWCRKCSRIWRVRRSQWSWKCWWYHVTDDGKAIPRIRNANTNRITKEDTSKAD